MNTEPMQLRSFRVKEVMTQDVLSLFANATMAEAAIELLRHGVCGAIVINEKRKLVCVFSTNDYASICPSPESQGVMRTAADATRILPR